MKATQRTNSQELWVAVHTAMDLGWRPPIAADINDVYAHLCMIENTFLYLKRNLIRRLEQIGTSTNSQL